MSRPLLGVTQRMAIAPGSGERRDCLAQDWRPFLAAVGVGWVVLPNHADTAARLAGDLDLAGVVLTGGDDIGVFPERDLAEEALVGWCRERSRPVLGVCRGLQFLWHLAGGRLAPVPAEIHVAKRHHVDGALGSREVNSYHNFSPDAAAGEAMRVLAHCRTDGTVEAAEGDGVLGIMWHPEREAEADGRDVALFRKCFAL
jgi:putative glutamine amidotransferase